jgi:hypothetical protein
LKELQCRSTRSGILLSSATDAMVDVSVRDLQGRRRFHVRTSLQQSLEISNATLGSDLCVIQVRAVSQDRGEIAETPKVWLYNAISRDLTQK